MSEAKTNVDADADDDKPPPRVVSVIAIDGMKMFIGLPPALDEDEEKIRPVKLGDYPPIVIENDKIRVVLMPDEAHSLAMALLESAHEAVTQSQLATFFVESVMMKPGGVRQMMEAFATHRYRTGSADRGREPKHPSSRKRLFQDEGVEDVEKETRETGERQ